MSANRCLYCYAPLDEGDFHPGCSRKMFGVFPPPELPYTGAAMQELAKQIVARSVSVPGVQAKLSLHLFSEKGKQKRARFTLVGLWGNYILKPPMTAYPRMAEIEDCTMHLAELCRIPAVPHSLIRLAPQDEHDKTGGAFAYITRRIDRTAKADRPIHMEDFCQLSGKLTEDKYRASLESCAGVIRKYSSNMLLDMLTFFELALFCFLTGNGDMHLKNFSLIYDDSGMIHFAPAYDLLSTRLLIPENKDPEEFALSMNGKKRNFTRNDFIAFGARCGLSSRQMENSLQKLGVLPGAAADLIGRSFLPEPLGRKYLALIGKRAKRLGIPAESRS